MGWRCRGRVRARAGVQAVVVMVALGLSMSVAAGNAAQHSALALNAQPAGTGSCRAPRLVGLTLARARVRAGLAGCRIHVVNGQIRAEEPMQLVARQNPAAGSKRRSINVWLVPLCAQSAAPGPPAREPIVTAGPTELISGVFLDGGPLVLRPTCQPGTPLPGTITIVNPATGATVASTTVATGKLATFPLAPGTYTIDGTLANATSGGAVMRTRPQTVTIPAGMTVRQDTAADIP
jgi:hypothetical protein